MCVFAACGWHVCGVSLEGVACGREGVSCAVRVCLVLWGLELMLVSEM